MKDTTPRKKHKKRPKDKNAPQKPLNGYVRYLNEHRNRVLEQNPGMEFADVTKHLAVEWSHLTDEQKQPFLRMAEEDRVRYKNEMLEYKNSESYRSFQQSLIQSKNDKSVVKKSSPQKKAATTVKATSEKKKPGRKPKKQVPVAATVQPKNKVWQDSPAATETDVWPVTPTGSDIPIFTPEFLEHNKIRETELRKLRKLMTELEEQNAILSKHIEKMKAAEAKLRSEMTQMSEKNVVVEDRLNQLKNEIVSTFANCPVPGTSLCPTVTNVSEYVDQLQQRLSVPKSVDNKENRVIQEKVQLILKKMASMDELCSHVRD